MLLDYTQSSMSTYTADCSGVASALYELGGMTVIHDASGCNSTYEPRWNTMPSAVFISALTEMDAVLGNDSRIIDDIVDAARKLTPAFVAIAGTPIPMMTGVDLKGIARLVESRTRIPSFAVQTNSMRAYSVGCAQAWIELSRRFVVPNGARAGSFGINLLGATPLDFSTGGMLESLRAAAARAGYTINACWAMGDKLESLVNTAAARVNVVVSSSGLPLAQCFERCFGTPYVCGLPVLERCEPWTLEKAAEVCWLDPKKIEEAIKLYCSGPAGVALGVATDQNENSVEAAMGSVILNALRGNVESPGALMQRNPSTNIVPAGSLATRCSYLLPKGQLKKRLGSNEHKGLMQWDAAQPSAVLEAMKTGKPYPIKVWLERSGNKFVVNGHAQDWIEGTKNVDLIVHMFLYPTSFSCYADILLPATEWLETNMLVECMNWVFARQPVAHVWETEDETLFWSKLIKKCAELGNENARRACDPAFMKKDLAYWDSMEELLDGRLANIGMTWKEFKEKQPFPYMPYDKWNTYYVYKQPDKKTGLPKGFGTPSKKLELYGEVWIELGRTGKPYALDEVPPVSVDYDPLPWYAEPAESPLRDIAKEFPLVLTNGRLPMFHHGTLRNNPYMRELYPVPEAWVNPVDAKKYGVAHDDWIWLESKRGKIRGKCRVTEGIPVGVVYMERFWFPETLNTKTQGWREMNVNVLSKNDAPFNRIVGTITLRGFQIRIRKASEGAPEGVWMKPEQFKAWLPQPTDTTKNPEL